MKALTYAAVIAASLVLGLAHASGGSDGSSTEASGVYPFQIAMPQGSVPEGIAIKGSQAFVTSLSTGAIYKVDLLSGDHDVFSPATGAAAAGIMLDGKGRLFIAEGGAGTARVIDSNTGKELASYKLAATDKTFVNDFTRLGNAIYVTESFSPFLYKLPLGEAGRLPDPEAVETIPLTGIAYGEGFNANGITPTPDGKALLIVQTNTGVLFRVNPANGVAEPVDIGDADLTAGDGMLLEGNALYVVRNMANTIAVLEINDDGTRARLKTELKDPGFDTPTAIARFNDRLYLTNARFTVGDAASADFTVNAVSYQP